MPKSAHWSIISVGRAKISSLFRGLFSPLANSGPGMPLSTRAIRKPYLATTGHNSGGASSTAGQPRRTAVSQMRSILHCHSVALRHQYASDCLMRPFVTAVCSSDAAKLGDGFLDGFELLDEGEHSVFGVIQLR